MMKLNSNGKIARFYLWFSDTAGLPPEFCTYFWGLIVRGFVCLVGVGMALFVVVLVAALLIALGRWLGHHKAANLFLAISLAVIAMTTWLYRKQIQIEILDETKTIVKGKIDSVKNKYCPRIDWQ